MKIPCSPESDQNDLPADDYQQEPDKYQPPENSNTPEYAPYSGFHNLEAEQAVLGGIMVEPDQFKLIDGKLAPEDFFSGIYATIFRAIIAVANLYGSPDPVLIRDELRAKGELENIGGKEALMRLSDSVISGAHTEHYAKIVKELSIRRRLIQFDNEGINKVVAPGTSSLDLIGEAQVELSSLATQKYREEPKLVKEAVNEIWEEIDFPDARGITGLSTGYLALDDLLKGLHQDELIILAGRPGMGKTTLVSNITRNLLLDAKTPIAFFSQEMGVKEITSQILTAQAKVPGQKMRQRRFNQKEIEKLAEASEKVAETPLRIDGTAAIPLEELRAKCRILQAKNQLKLVIIDHLQLMSASRAAKNRNREQEMSEISQGLKALAVELHLPVIALSQLSRRSENRQEQRPLLSDLRDSGAIEANADVVMFIHRPDYYHKDEQPGVAEIIVAKQRNGPTDTIRLTFLKEFRRFENYSSEHQRD